jgi:rubredoxin
MKKKWKKVHGKKGLIHTLDRVFSEYIRRRDANSFGLCRCITCGRYGNWQYEMDAGHFISRNKPSIRFNPLNAAAQCPNCNRFSSGKQYEFGLAIDRKYGKGTAEQLLILSKMKSKYTDELLQLKIDEFRQKIKELKNKQSC